LAGDFPPFLKLKIEEFISILLFLILFKLISHNVGK